MFKTSLLALLTLVTAILAVSGCSPRNELPHEPPPGAERYPAALAGAPKRTAYDIYMEMVEASLTGEEKPLLVEGTNGSVTFGAEKESSSFLISRIMGPKKDLFRRYVTEMPERERALFLRDFMSGWTSGRYRLKDVRNVKGEPVFVDLSGIEGTRWATADPMELQQKFDLWLERAGDRSWSFITPQTRRKLFKGELPGQDPAKNFGSKNSPYRAYQNWVAHYGDPEKYILNAHNTGPGWEVNFLPQKTYAEFEKMQTWFRTSLKNAGSLFEAPGHQRLVFPKRTQLSVAEKARLEARMAEMYKNIQALMLLRAQAGMAQIETAGNKAIFSDTGLESLSTGRGIFRLEQNRDFGLGEGSAQTYAIEMRGGTKSAPIRRMIQQTIASRYAANDFEGLLRSNRWTLVDGNHDYAKAEYLARKYGVSKAVAEKAISNLSNASIERRGYGRSIGRAFWSPFWNWENAPFIKDAKKVQLKELTRIFIESIAAWESPGTHELQLAFSQWATASHVIEDLERYVLPRRPAGNLGASLRYASRGPVDVNAIDLGIEYSARFPVKLAARYTERPLADGKSGWLETLYDQTPEERKAVLFKTAQDLGSALKSEAKPRFVQDSSGHGHSLDLAYEIDDAKGRTWRVEWDGIGRDYDSDGSLIDDSLRGGHVEVVTPKFTPTPEDIRAVNQAFDAGNLIPSLRGGGGHINIDLAAFKGKPRQLARFLSVFHQHRGTMAIMFQDPRRIRSAEPAKVNAELARKLADFNGTEEELKKLLYDNRYFNTPVGRKTKYMQLELSSYFQDVIPAELIHQDYDLKNEAWRKNFDVDPNIRKMEFRMFNAPRTAEESALQIKFVRAMLDKALNDSTPLKPMIQEVSYEAGVRDPQAALDEFQRMAADLGLEPSEYKPFMLEGLAGARDYLTTDAYAASRARTFAEAPNWGQAVPARGPSQALRSKGRIWSGTPEPVALEFQQARQRARLQIEPVRGSLDPSAPRRGYISRAFASSRSIESQVLEKGLAALEELEPAEKAAALLKIAGNPGPLRMAAQTMMQENYARIDKAGFESLIQHPDKKVRDWALLQLKNGDGLSDGAAARLLSSADPEVRAFGYAVLAKESDSRLPAVLSYSSSGEQAGPLHSGDRAIQREAWKKLLEIRRADPNLKIPPAVLEMIRNLGDPESIWYAAEVLRASSGEEIENALVKFCADLTDINRSRGCAHALSGLRQHEKLVKLKFSLKGSPDRVTARYADKALQEILKVGLRSADRLSALDVLWLAWQESKDPSKADEIRVALERIGLDPEKLTAALDLVPTANDPEFTAWALKFAEGKPFSPGLIQSGITQLDAESRQLAHRMLQALPDAKYSEVVTGSNAFASASPEVQGDLWKSLLARNVEELNMYSVSGWVFESARGPMKDDAAVLDQIAKILVRARTEPAIEQGIRKLVYEGNPLQQELAVAVIKAHPKSEALSPHKFWLAESPVASVKAKALEAIAAIQARGLAEFAGLSTVDTLFLLHEAERAGLSDPNSIVAIEAVLTDPKSESALVAMLDHPSAEFRDWTIKNYANRMNFSMELFKAMLKGTEYRDKAFPYLVATSKEEQFFAGIRAFLSDYFYSLERSGDRALIRQAASLLLDHAYSSPKAAAEFHSSITTWFEDSQDPETIWSYARTIEKNPGPASHRLMNYWETPTLEKQRALAFMSRTNQKFMGADFQWDTYLTHASPEIRGYALEGIRGIGLHAEGTFSQAIRERSIQEILKMTPEEMAAWRLKEPTLNQKLVLFVKNHLTSSATKKGQWEAAQLLMRLPASDIMPMIAALMRDPTPVLSQEARRSLAFVASLHPRNDSARALATTLASSEDRIIQRYAKAALGQGPRGRLPACVTRYLDTATQAGP